MTFPKATFPSIPPEVESLKYDNVEQARRALAERLERRHEMLREVALLEAEIQWVGAYICGENDLQDVELYDGRLGVSRAFVDQFEPMIGQLQWWSRRDLEIEFGGPGESPGDVGGRRWGAGALLKENLFLTAGHCFDPTRIPYRLPRRRTGPIGPEEMARYMRVNFKYQVDGPETIRLNKKVVRKPVQYVVKKLEECKPEIDYAIVRLGQDQGVEPPGAVFGELTVASRDLKKIGETLCVIQHPNQAPKKIEAGALREASMGRLTYADIDTGGGASGAPILSESGEIVGIHTHGGCLKNGGFNSGVAIGVIKGVSNIL